MEREVRVERSPAHCPYCKGALEDITKLVACAACGARHHDVCHAEHGRCASCGESASLAPLPRTSRTGEPPQGSKVSIERADGASTIRMPMPPSTVMEFAPAGSTDRRIAGRAALGGLAAAALAGVAATVGLLTLQALAVLAAVVLASVASLLFLVAAAVLITFKRVEHPARTITLGEELDFPTSSGASRKGTRGQIGNVRTERFTVAEHTHVYRLTIDIGVDRIAVALPRGLKEPEIDWMADVIRAWKAEA